GAGGAGTVATALAVFSSGEGEQPVITAAALPTAVRIKKPRRSTPCGISCAINRRVSANGSSRKASRDVAVERGVSADSSASLFDIDQPLPFHRESRSNLSILSVPHGCTWITKYRDHVERPSPAWASDSPRRCTCFSSMPRKCMEDAGAAATRVDHNRASLAH